MINNKILSNQRINWRITYIVALFCFFSVAFYYLILPRHNIVEKGVADLTSLDLSSSEVILSGNWELYWNRMLKPEDFKKNKQPQLDDYIMVPGSWQNKNSVTGEYPKYGVATYRINIDIPDTLKDPAIRIRRVSRAFKLYANGNLLAEVGKVSGDPGFYEAGATPIMVNLPRNDNTIEIIMQVANLDYDRGGIREAPLFGSRALLDKGATTALIMQIFFIGLIFAFFLLYLLYYLLDRNNLSYLAFAFICLTTAFRASLWGDIPMLVLFPDTPINLGVFIHYLSGYLTLPLLLLLLTQLFPIDYRKKHFRIILLPTLFFLSLLFTPQGFMASLNLYYYAYLVMLIVYGFIILTRAVLRGRRYSFIMLFTVSAFVLTIVSDATNYMVLGGSFIPYMSLFGNVVIIFAMSAIITSRQKDINRELIRLNKELLETEALKVKMKDTEISFLQAQIKPHFLYNALNAIAYVSEEDGQRGSNLILDLSVYLRNSLEFNNMGKTVILGKELGFVETYFRIEQARFGEKIKLKLNIDAPDFTQIPFFILQPLVENAVRHGISKKREGGTVTLSVKLIDDKINVVVEDDGVGIKPEALSLILDNARERKSLGLVNINQRLTALYGIGLEIASEAGKGTCISFTLGNKTKKG